MMWVKHTEQPGVFVWCLRSQSTLKIIKTIEFNWKTTFYSSAISFCQSFSQRLHINKAFWVNLVLTFINVFNLLIIILNIKIWNSEVWNLTLLQMVSQLLVLHSSQEVQGDVQRQLLANLKIFSSRSWETMVDGLNKELQLHFCCNKSQFEPIVTINMESRSVWCWGTDWRLTAGLFCRNRLYRL